ncbi:MAG: DUF5723 family protein [Ekhidna sp.]
MKKHLITILSLFILFASNAQTSVSFYHLRNTTFQNSYLNPAWVPDGKVFLGLPGLSGVHVHLNNKLGYNDIFTKENNRPTVDGAKIVSNLQSQNILSAHVNVNLLHFGYKFNKGATLSIFANERVEADFLYSKNLIKYLNNGNIDFINDELKIDNVGLRVQHFREIGIGYAFQPNNKLSYGLKAKYLQGFADASTPHNLKANISSNGEFFEVDAEVKNGVYRTSGLDIYQGNGLVSHLISNSNKGFALDLGIDYKLSRYYSVALSVLDIGYIKWSENVVNKTVNDTTFTYSGIALDELGNVRETLEDSLFNKLKPTETNDPYNTFLPSRMYSSWTYHYSDQLSFSATVGARYLQRKMKMLYGGAVTYKFGRALTASASAVKLPQQFFNVGASLAARGGPVQFYIAADQVINFSLPDAKAIDFRIGMNFIFGGWRRGGKDANSDYSSPFSSQSRPKTKAKGIDTGVFLGSEVKTKRREGIYSIIKRQKKRQVDTSLKKRKKGVTKKALPAKKFEE